MRLRPVLTCLTFICVLSACHSSSRIDTAVTRCCTTVEYTTFSVAVENVPAFLGPLMVSNFSVAFANRGMQPVESGADLLVTLRYEQSNLSREEPYDDFDERITTGDPMRFIARIVVDIRDASTKELVWLGYVQRLHNVAPGDYMHTGPASISIYEAFTDLLEDYQ